MSPYLWHLVVWHHFHGSWVFGLQVVVDSLEAQWHRFNIFQMGSWDLEDGLSEGLNVKKRLQKRVHVASVSLVVQASIAFFVLLQVIVRAIETG